jgi:hypothetical protein
MTNKKGSPPAPFFVGCLSIGVASTLFISVLPNPPP